MNILSLDEQSVHLANVSRTFALTIPLLPLPLRDWVGNAYLLCRIADTIEDDPELRIDDKIQLLSIFVKSLQEKNLIDESAKIIYESLKNSANEKELLLIKDIPLVVRRFYSYTSEVQNILKHGVEIMCKGMSQITRWNNISTLDDVDHYCYSVAGVVGELLLYLFAEYSTKIKEKIDILRPLSVAFGEGLQLTNILKDIWDDAERGIKWLPIDMSSEKTIVESKRYFISVAYGHIQQACEFIYLIPRRETGIREFCLLANAMAVLTLKNIYERPLFKDKTEIKISRSDVKKVVAQTRFLVYCNFGLKMLFAHYAGSKMQPCLRDVVALHSKVSLW